MPLTDSDRVRKFVQRRALFRWESGTAIFLLLALIGLTVQSVQLGQLLTFSVWGAFTALAMTAQGAWYWYVKSETLREACPRTYRDETRLLARYMQSLLAGSTGLILVYPLGLVLWLFSGPLTQDIVLGTLLYLYGLLAYIHYHHIKLLVPIAEFRAALADRRWPPGVLRRERQRAALLR